jgi:dipeptidyl aminopeptidase/acylaminoacyl peptidase
MRVWLAVLVAAGLGPLAALQPVAYPEFDSERGIRWSSTREECAAARADTRFVMEQFTYRSDDLTVSAHLYRPRHGSDHRLPVIVYNRGSFTRPTGFVGEMLAMAHRFAEAGFVVVTPSTVAATVGRDAMSWAAPISTI